MLTLNEMLKNTVKRFPNKTFIVSDDQVLTYLEFDNLTSKLANVLKSRGIKKGDTVGLYLPNRPELAVGYYACQKIGAVAVPMNLLYRFREVESIVQRTSMALIITTPENYDIVLEVKKQMSCLQNVLVTGGESPRDADLLEKAIQSSSSSIETVDSNLDDVAVMFFTSGTTGSPKGAMQTHGSIYATVQDMNAFWKFRYGNERILSVLPLFNNFGATVNMNGVIYNGGTLYLIERWNTEKVLQSISDYQITFFSGTPTMYLYILEKYSSGNYDLTSLRLCITAGSIISSETIDKVERELKVRLIQVYGATESSGAVTGEPVIGVRKKGSTGIPFGSTTIKIVDDNGNEVPPGQVGEVVIQGDTIGKGYWDDPNTTSISFKSDGWYSGDLGYLDEAGYLYIKDRKKDVIICGGSNIFPIEVEDVLYTLPDVSIAAVVGVPDELKGEIPKAYIVLKNDAQITGDEVIAYCRQNLSAYKIPRLVEFIDNMPLGPNGKILKRELRNQNLDKNKEGNHAS